MVDKNCDNKQFITISIVTITEKDCISITDKRGIACTLSIVRGLSVRESIQAFASARILDKKQTAIAAANKMKPCNSSREGSAHFQLFKPAAGKFPQELGMTSSRIRGILHGGPTGCDNRIL